VCAVLAAQQANPLTGPLIVQIEIFPPDNRRRDIDNVQKALLDALQHGGAYYDDSQIVSLSITKRDMVPQGRTLVTIQRAAC
jgi:crossover junction endodeoxyribonuclease RusA